MDVEKSETKEKDGSLKIITSTTPFVNLETRAATRSEVKGQLSIEVPIRNHINMNNDLIDDYDEQLPEDGVLLSPSSSSSVATSGGTQNDATFEPTIDMMVNDFDDEQTLNEEEALAELESHNSQLEIDTLKEEADMPLEALLAKYQLMTAPVVPSTPLTISPVSRRCRTKNSSEREHQSTSRNSEYERKPNNRKKNKWKERSHSESDEKAKHPRKENDRQSSSGNENDANGILNVDEINKIHSDKIEEVIVIESSDEKDAEPETDPCKQTKECKGIDNVEDGDQVSVKNDDDKDVNSIGGRQQTKKVRRTHLMDLYPAGLFDKLEGKKTRKNSNNTTSNIAKDIPLESLYGDVCRKEEDCDTVGEDGEEEDDDDYEGDINAGEEEEEEEDDDEDIDYDDEFKKKVMVGPAFQAIIPIGLSQYGDVLPYENEDKLIWEPSQVSEYEVEEYLQKVRDIKANLGNEVVDEDEDDEEDDEDEEDEDLESSETSEENNSRKNMAMENGLEEGIKATAGGVSIVNTGSSAGGADGDIASLNASTSSRKKAKTAHKTAVATVQSNRTNTEEKPNIAESVDGGSGGVGGGGVVRDNEQALHLLVQCGYDFGEALRRKSLNALPLNDTMSLWSEEECQKFEEGIQKYGKDFLKIRQNQVRTRTMRELVQFYYLWKKSERRDQNFANADTVDHMDLYLNEDNEYGSVGGSCPGNTIPFAISTMPTNCSGSGGINPINLMPLMSSTTGLTFVSGGQLKGNNCVVPVESSSLQEDVEIVENTNNSNQNNCGAGTSGGPANGAGLASGGCNDRLKTNLLSVSSSAIGNVSSTLNTSTSAVNKRKLNTVDMHLPSPEVIPSNCATNSSGNPNFTGK